MLPDNSNVVILGDGEFDGINFLQLILDYGWQFAVRTAKNATIYKNKNKINLPAKLVKGVRSYHLDVLFTSEKFGPVTIVSSRFKKDKHLSHIISSSREPLKIKQWYKKRVIIETLFSDKKSRGFKLDKSHISDIARIGRLMIATSLAYIWLVLLGSSALASGLNKEFHRTERCDLSLLQLGFRMLEFMINGNKPMLNTLFLQDNSLCVR